MLEQMRRYAKLKKMPQLITMHSNREFSDETPAFTDPDPVTTSRALTDAVSSGLEYAKGVAPAGPIKEWIEKAISKLSPADGSRGLDFYALQGGGSGVAPGGKGGGDGGGLGALPGG